MIVVGIEQLVVFVLFIIPTPATNRRLAVARWRIDVVQAIEHTKHGVIGRVGDDVAHSIGNRFFQSAIDRDEHVAQVGKTLRQPTNADAKPFYGIHP